MKTIKFTYWQDSDYYLGFLNDYPDYQRQGLSKEELIKNPKDLLADLESGSGSEMALRVAARPVAPARHYSRAG